MNSSGAVTVDALVRSRVAGDEGGTGAIESLPVYWAFVPLCVPQSVP